MEEESSVVLFKVPTDKGTKSIDDDDDDDLSYNKSFEKSTVIRDNENVMCDKSTFEEEEPHTKTGTNPEEDDDDSDEYYDLSDDEDDEEDEEDCEEDSTLVEVLNAYGDPVSDDTLLYSMERDKRSFPDKIKLLPKIRRYLKSIHDSEGFDCTDCPGGISGITSHYPIQFLIHNRDLYPEGYNHLMFMSSLALKDYNEKQSTKFQVVDVEKANSS